MARSIVWQLIAFTVLLSRQELNPTKLAYDPSWQDSWLT